MSDELCTISVAPGFNPDTYEEHVYAIPCADVRDKTTYFSRLSHICDFPIKDEAYWDQVNDWLNEFSWPSALAKEGGVNIALMGYDTMFWGCGDEKQTAIDLFTGHVFVYWRARNSRPYRVFLAPSENGCVHRALFRVIRTDRGETDAPLRNAWFSPGDGVFPERVEKALLDPNANGRITMDLSPEEALKSCFRSIWFDHEKPGDPIQYNFKWYEGPMTVEVEKAPADYQTSTFYRICE